MLLSSEDVKLFYKLFANERHQIEDVTTEDQLMYLPAERRIVVRETLFHNDHLIEEFVSSNPKKFLPQELDIVLSWKAYLKGRFYLFRQLRKYAIFLTFEKEMKAYGVLAAADLFSELVTFIPIVVDTVLCPLKGQIIYDGLMSSQNIYFGGGIKRSLNDSYNEAEARYGVITSLTDTTVTVKVTSDI